MLFLSFKDVYSHLFIVIKISDCSADLRLFSVLQNGLVFPRLSRVSTEGAVLRIRYIDGYFCTHLRNLCAFPTSCFSNNYQCLIVLYQVKDVISKLKGKIDLIVMNRDA